MKARPLIFTVLWIASLFAAFWLRPALPLAGRDPRRENPAAQASSRVGTVDKNPSISGQKSHDVADVIARSEEWIRKPNELASSRETARNFGPLLEWTPSEIQEALALIEASKWSFEQKAAWYEYLLPQWAETEGKAAMAFVERLSAGDDPGKMFIRMALSQSVLEAWILWAPDDAWRWAQHFNVRTGRGTTVALALAKLAGHDLPKVLQLLETLEEDRDEAATAIAGRVSTDGARQRILEYAESLEPAERADVYSALLQNWITADTAAAQAWIETRPKEEQASLSRSAGFRLLHMQPETAARMMLAGVSANGHLSEVHDRIARDWPFEDFAGLEKWLAAQPEGPGLDRARYVYAARIRDLDPAKAMSYAKAMEDGPQRVRSVALIYEVWLQRDRPAAQAAMQAEGLTEEMMIENLR